MPDQTLYEQLKQKVQELTDSLESLSFSFWKKTGPAPSGITGTDLESTNFVTGSSGWRLDADGNLEANNGNFRGDITGASGTFSGTVTVSSLNIPNATTADSMHVDSAGNTWWGANVANGISTALASITKAGVITAKNILIGGASIQYQVVNGGMQSFGDGSDGAAVFNGTDAVTGASRSGTAYTLTRDVYYTDATLSTGVTINPAGYRIFGTGTLTLNGTAKIFRDGNAGTIGTAGSNNANGGAGGAGGAALADGYLKGAVAGKTGGAGGNSQISSQTAGTAGTAGANTSNSIGSNGAAAGAGGTGGSSAPTGPSTPGAAGAAGTATASNVLLIANWHLATLLDIGPTGATVKFDNSAGSGSGGGGGAGGNNGSNGAGSGGGGGGSGSSGGIIAIYFRAIVIGASASITANGGAGATGGAGGAGDVGSGCGGGGGGGAGGNGGQIILVYNTISNSGTLTASAGAAGSGGAHGGDIGFGTNHGTDGSAGAAGTAGTIRQFAISM